MRYEKFITELILYLTYTFYFEYLKEDIRLKEKLISYYLYYNLMNIINKRFYKVPL